MPIAFDKNLAEGNHGTGTWTTTGTLNIATGVFVVVGVGFATGSTPVVTDLAGNTYTGRTAYSGAAVAVRLFYAYNVTGNAAMTWTVTGTGILASMAIMSFSGVNTASDPYDKESGSTYFATTPATPGAFTPTNDNSLVVSFLSHNNTSPAFACASFTIKDQVALSGGSNYGVCSAYVIQTSKASVNASWSDTSGNQGGVNQANFDAPGGGPAFLPREQYLIMQAVNRASRF